MEIRTARKLDIAVVDKIYSDIITAQEEGKISVGWIRNSFPTTLTAMGAQMRGQLFVGEVDCQIVGTAIIGPEQLPEYKDVEWKYPAAYEDVLTIHGMATDPEFFGRGYGSEFLKFYEDYAARKGIHYLRLSANDVNRYVAGFLTKRGYIPAGSAHISFTEAHNLTFNLFEKRI